MTLNNIMLYQYISVSLSHPHRCFFLQKMENNTETQNGIMCREWEILEHSILNGMSSSNATPQWLRDLFRGEKESMWESEGMPSRNPCLQIKQEGLVYIGTWRDYGGMTKACTCLCQWGPSTERKKWKQVPTHKLSEITMYWQMKN